MRRSRATPKRIVAMIVAVALLVVTVPPVVATHGDGVYDQPVIFEWEKEDVENGEIDILILPPGHGQLFNGNGVLAGGDTSEAQPCTNSYVDATRDTLQGFRDGIDAYGPDWLKNGLRLDSFVLHCDGPITEAPQDPDIVVYTDATKAFILGFALTSEPCLVNSSKFFVASFTYNDMYNVMGQELGHCLGLGHVGGDSDHPAHDVLDGSYGHTPGSPQNHRHCVSNLNVAGLEHVFDQVFDRDVPGDKGTVKVDSYDQINC